MRGSPVYQVEQLYKKSGINQIGQSKHRAKMQSRKAGRLTWSDLSASLGIYSYATADAYREVWIQVFEFARESFGIKSILDLTGDMVKDYLEVRIEDGVALNTYTLHAAACQKLEVALDLFDRQIGDIKKPRKYLFVKKIDATRPTARHELKDFEGSRAYDDPEVMIAALVDDKFSLAAKIQLYGGPRVREVSLIRRTQLRGVKNDPHTGEEKGYFEIQGKGGKMTLVGVPIETYKALHDMTLKKDFRFNPTTYRRALKVAAEATGQKYNGSHGLRWNFARERKGELQENGLFHEEAMQEVSRDMGHERPSISSHYMR